MDKLLSSLLSLSMNYCPPCLLYGLKSLDDYELLYDFLFLYALWLSFDAKGGEKFGIKSRTHIIK